MLLGQSLRPILLGLALGGFGGYGLSRALNALFFRMAVADPLVFAGVAALMLAVALGAAWVPARRVTRIHPQQALRCE
jgi:ABC-type antimicrobial peptide transport system permease subunit